MSNKHNKQASTLENMPQTTIAIGATFTAEPLEESLSFWGRELQIPFKIEFAPYNQVFQQLLDPSSLISSNENGMNVILLRFEDWTRNENNLLSNLDALEKKRIRENAVNLIDALKSSSQRSATPYVICMCPPSPPVTAERDRMAIYAQMEDLLVSELGGLGNVHLIKTSELNAAYPVSEYHDPQGEELGHIPYTPAFFTALGTMIARKFHSIVSAPHKVVVLDCDQTLWKGVCGEDGPLGIEIDPPRRKLQEFMVRQHDSGMLICLCSKNSEEDVVQVFEHRPEMPLKRDHIVSWRINWQPKSENMKSLANELQLGIDSFILIDDNPIECAEVQANCPEVLTLQLPQETRDISRFLEHMWPFDRVKTTEEDKTRTAMYQQNIKREQFLQESVTLADFLASLELEIEIFEPMPHHLARVAQLTQRTNQFNFTTIRRSEAEVKKLSESGTMECLAVEVSDRFGDYGLVGVMLFASESKAIKIDTFLVSCRALGRGVEHRMLAKLGEIATERELSHVEATYIPTKKNQPALDFLDGVGSQYKDSLDSKIVFKFPAGSAKGVSYSPGLQESMASVDLPNKRPAHSQTSAQEMDHMRAKSERFRYIAENLYNAEQIANKIESQQRKQRPDLPTEYVAPSNELERAICRIWQKVLAVEKVGINDNFFEIGGQSLLAIRIISNVRKEIGVSLTLPHLFDAPTVASIASHIAMLQFAKREKQNIASLATEEREMIEF